jgi:uncharacterized zinc-type alcohol dehydrogenase-like protein
LLTRVLGRVQFCKDKEQTIINRHGGFADYIRVNAHYAFPIPEGLKPEDAAPLVHSHCAHGLFA